MSNEEIQKGIPKKRKKFNKKRIALLLIVLIIIVVAIIIGIGNLRQKENAKISGEEYVQILNDGTKLNQSPKIKEEKQIEGLTVSNIQLTEKDNISVILADITNNSNQVKGGFTVNIKLLDDTGKTITTIIGFISEIEPNASTQLSTQTTLDFANSYDIIIEKAQ